MPCLIGCLAMFLPRVVMLAVLVFKGGYVERAFHERFIWPLLGFLFMPVTTLAFAWGFNANNGNIDGIYLVVVIVAGFVDLCSLGTGGWWGRRRRVKKIYVERPD